MTKPQTARRGRGRNPKRNKPGNGGRNDFRAKGNPKQLLDKYKSLARDAMQGGDRVLAENYFQHADHYQRVLNERNGLNSGVYEEPEDHAVDSSSDAEESAAPPRRRRSRSQRSEEAAASEQEQQMVEADDPRRRPKTDADGEEKTADASEGKETEVKRLRRSRRNPKASARGNGEDSKASAADTAAE